MSELIIKSMTPVPPGWWARFTEANDKGETEVWYSPVAAWALCKCQDTVHGFESEGIYPVFASEVGMEAVEQECELLYLPHGHFRKDNKPWCFAYYPVNGT